MVLISEKKQCTSNSRQINSDFPYDILNLDIWNLEFVNEIRNSITEIEVFPCLQFELQMKLSEFQIENSEF